MASEKPKECVDLTQEDDNKPKKMKQMRLPFASIDKNSAIRKMTEEVKKAVPTTPKVDESKKRKHSAESTEDEEEVKKVDEVPKVKLGSAKKKAKIETIEEPLAKENKEATSTIRNDEPMEVEIVKPLEPTKLLKRVPSEAKVEVTTPKEPDVILDSIVKTPDQKKRSESSSSTDSSKKQTPKQLARKAELEKKREEKERLKEEAKLSRELAKKKELEKKEAERKEKEAQKEQERLEKERQKQEKEKEKERQKKEKEEEKLKKKEEKEKQKEEERIKKEEAAKKKQEEKEEKERQEKIKAEKLKKSFANFFVKKETVQKEEIAETKISNNGLNQFRVKQNMRLAPLHRYSDFDKSKMDLIIKESAQIKDNLYLKLLKKGQVEPQNQGKTWPYALRKDDDDEVEVIEDEDDEIGDEIVENDEKETTKKTVIVGKVFKKAKLLQFHDNQRPAYFGTWSKKSMRIRARRPFAMDSDNFDYDYDSDDDWEEEEQGESLSDEEKDKEEDEKEAEKDEEDDDGFFVGHGVLDKDELKTADDENEDAFDEELEMKKQKLKAQQFEEEYKKKKPTKLKPRVFGCFWNDPDMEGKDNELRIAYDQLIKILNPFKAVALNGGGIISTSVSNPKADGIGGNKDTPDKLKESGKKSKPLKQVPEEAMPELIRLVHANTNNKVFLAKEFCEFWNKKSEATLSKTKALAKIQEIAEYQKSEILARKCWLVKDEVIKNYNMLDIEVPNKWDYILDQPNKAATATPTPTNTPVQTTPAKPDCDSTPKADRTPGSSKLGTPAQLITKFTKVLSEEERQKALAKSAAKASQASPKPPPPAFSGGASSSNAPVNVLTPKRRIQPTLIDLTKN